MEKQKIVVKVGINGEKKIQKALQIAVGVSGVESASFVGSDKDQIAVTGVGIDSIELTTLLRKKIGYTELVSVGPADAKKDEKDPKPGEATMQFDPYPYYYYNYGVPYYYVYPY
ncbi:hypothetical protein M8C21_011535 [Ambrosia artemisiifolia]|uniref:Uncharacterized protein n=1 Tax=Ambrosia artemisiifolia TaxID=4212 RepID=A0AAD5CSZ5_AMBAR|nr:hypothetical protein M8C21_011535 [Ambrosia artemisiifolia]